MDIIKELFQIGAVKFGSFTLKNGMVSPFYIDLRLSVSYPKILVALAEAIHAKAKSFSFDLLCGVPYAALPFATAISIHHNIPMILLRKEKKEYGTKKRIEGVFHPNQHCLLIEDVVTTGQSIFETKEALEAEGLKVTDAFVLVDREQGGAKSLSQKGVRLHSVFTVSSLVNHLESIGKIDTSTKSLVLEFIKTHRGP